LTIREPAGVAPRAKIKFVHLPPIFIPTLPLPLTMVCLPNPMKGIFPRIEGSSIVGKTARSCDEKDRECNG
jgi:hypothetical protein